MACARGVVCKWAQWVWADKAAHTGSLQATEEGPVRSLFIDLCEVGNCPVPEEARLVDVLDTSGSAGTWYAQQVVKHPCSDQS